MSSASPLALLVVPIAGHSVEHRAGSLAGSLASLAEHCVAHSAAWLDEYSAGDFAVISGSAFVAVAVIGV